MNSNVAAVLTSVAMFALSAPAAAVTIINGSFELGSFTAAPFDTLAAGSAVITGWTIGGGGVDWIGSYWQPSEGARSLDLSALNPGSVSQDIATQAGNSYRISFDLAGNVAGGPTVKDLDLLIDDGVEISSSFGFDTGNNTLTSMGWLTYTFEFVAASALTKLSFVSNTAGSNGPALDNVSIADITILPDPATWLSMVAGLGLVGGMARRRRAALA